MVSIYKRWITENILNSLKYRRVLILSGARQVGKSTLSRQIATEYFEFRTLDDTSLLDFALKDPKGFIKTKAKTLIIDEVQKAPLIIPEIKQVVDLDNRPGQFFLTGSVNLQTLPSVQESLAGRVKNIRLRSLSVGEFFNKKANFLKKAFNLDFPLKIEGFDKEAIFDFAFSGGYPEVLNFDNISERKSWYKDYIKTLIDFDLVDISNIRRKDILEDLFLVLCSFSSKFIDMDSIGSSFALSRETLKSYINWLLSLYVFDRVPPFIKTDYDRVGKRYKIYSSDTGIMTSLLSWNKDNCMFDMDKSGKLMETFVYNELIKQIELDQKYSLSQYRDRNKREIDFIVERDDGNFLGIEVKAGHNVSKDDFNHQFWFQENILKSKEKYTGLVLYSGDKVIQFAQNMMAVPIASLWTE